ncbi:MAG: hypothetical protein ACSLFQ_02620 [Thermoanaerobaculia bacterium]
MTQLFEKAIPEASKLSDAEQDRIARWLLSEIESDLRWDEAFSTSADELSGFASQALREHRDGKTRRLDPDKP